MIWRNYMWTTPYYNGNGQLYKLSAFFPYSYYGYSYKLPRYHGIPKYAGILSSKESPKEIFQVVNEIISHPNRYPSHTTFGEKLFKTFFGKNVRKLSVKDFNKPLQSSHYEKIPIGIYYRKLNTELANKGHPYHSWLRNKIKNNELNNPFVKLLSELTLGYYD